MQTNGDISSTNHSLHTNMMKEPRYTHWYSCSTSSNVLLVIAFYCFLLFTL